MVDHYRKNDPETSVASGSNLDDLPASEIVLRILAEWNIPMNDEEIAAAAHRNGVTLSADRLRHGRLMLYNTSQITGCGKRKTIRGADSTAWVLAAPTVPASPQPAHPKTRRRKKRMKTTSGT